jgi:hypothetical protein
MVRVGADLDRGRANDLEFTDPPVGLLVAPRERLRPVCEIEMALIVRAYAVAPVPTSGLAGRPGPYKQRMPPASAIHLHTYVVFTALTGDVLRMPRCARWTSVR